MDDKEPSSRKIGRPRKVISLDMSSQSDLDKLVHSLQEQTENLERQLDELRSQNTFVQIMGHWAGGLSIKTSREGHKLNWVC